MNLLDGSDNPVPLTPPTGTFTAVSPATPSGGDSSTACAIRTDGSLVCWGVMGWGEAGNQLPARTPAGTFTAVSVGPDDGCAIRPDGTVACWGPREDSGRPLPTTVIGSGANWLPTSAMPLRWSSIPLFAPVTSYDVVYTQGRWDQGSLPSVWDENYQNTAITWREATTTTSATFTGSPGYTYCFSVRAHDAEGLTSEWASFQPCTALPLDDRSLVKSARWTAVKGSNFYLGTALRSTRINATLRLTGIDAAWIGLLATTCPTCGTVEITFEPKPGSNQDVDASPPGPETVSLRSATRLDRQVVWSYGGEENSPTGTFSLRVASRGKPVMIDGLVIHQQLLE